MFLFIFERERGREGERERAYEWGRVRERRGQRIRSGLRADSRKPDVGLELTSCELTT